MCFMSSLFFKRDVCSLNMEKSLNTPPLNIMYIISGRIPPLILKGKKCLCGLAKQTHHIPSLSRLVRDGCCQPHWTGKKGSKNPF